MLPSILVQFMFAHVENTYFSHRWWMSLAEAERNHLRDLALIHNPYYEHFEYVDAQLVPWSVLGADFGNLPNLAIEPTALLATRTPRLIANVRRLPCKEKHR